MMTFDSHIGLGAILNILLLIAGAGGAWATAKIVQKFTLEKLKELKDDVADDRKKGDEQHTQNVQRFQSLELKIANECLKKDDFEKFERRFDTKIDKVEHAVGNAATKAAGMIIDMMKASGLSRGDRS